MGSRRGSSAPVEGLQVVQVDSPEIRRKYEAQIEDVKLQANARARELDRMLSETRKELDAMGRKFAQAFAERTAALQDLERLKASIAGAPKPQAVPSSLRPLGPSQASRVSALERENEKLRAELSAKRQAVVSGFTREESRAPAKAAPLLAWLQTNRAPILVGAGLVIVLILLLRKG